MTKAISYEDGSYKMYYGYSSIRQCEGYREGLVYTLDGIVEVYTAKGKPGRTVLDFVYRGEQHRREYAACLTDRGLITKAKRFAKEIVDGK